jgi:hypothetical protein
MGIALLLLFYLDEVSGQGHEHDTATLPLWNTVPCTQ